MASIRLRDRMPPAIGPLFALALAQFAVASAGCNGSGPEASRDGGLATGGAAGSGGRPGNGGVGGAAGIGSGGLLGGGGTIGGGGGSSTGSGGVGASDTPAGGAGGAPDDGSGMGGGGAGIGAGGARGLLLRIMPLGDSTTASICYRSHLWQMLTEAGRTQFDFIGSRNGNPGCVFSAYDRDNEGHGGYIVSDILKATTTGRPGGADTSDPFDASAKDLATWFDGRPANVVMMHFGTNDVWNNVAPQTILAAYSAILGRLRQNSPRVRVLVAQITPLNPAGCSTCVARVQALNALIPGWAAQNRTVASPILVVDQFTGFNPATDTVDGVHANDSGSVKIATNWYRALISLF